MGERSLGTGEEADKKLTEDPCLECDTRERCISYLDGTQLVIESPESVGGRSVLHQIIKRYQESCLKYQHFSEAAFEGVVFHKKGIFIESNQQFADMLGYELDEINGLNGLDLFAPESRELAREKIASGDEGPYKANCLRKDGSAFIAEIRAKSIPWRGEEARVAVIRDLTEQKEMERQLIESEKRYRELYHNARACLYRTRISDGMLLDCSRATARLFGYANEDQYKENFSVTSTYVDPQQRQALIEALTKDKRVHGFELQLKRKDGTALWVAMSAEIFPEQDFIEGAMRDITVTKVLTHTEKDILKLLMQGLSNKEIAFKTGRSVRTVEDHRAHIMQKLGVDNIVDLTQKALNLPNHHTEK